MKSSSPFPPENDPSRDRMVKRIRSSYPDAIKTFYRELLELPASTAMPRDDDHAMYQKFAYLVDLPAIAPDKGTVTVTGDLRASITGSSRSSMRLSVLFRDRLGNLSLDGRQQTANSWAWAIFGDFWAAKAYATRRHGKGHPYRYTLFLGSDNTPKHLPRTLIESGHHSLLSQPPIRPAPLTPPHPIGLDSRPRI